MYTFKFPVVNEDGTDGLLTIGVKIDGRYIPATWDEPGEEPEIEEVVVMDEDGKEVIDDISEELLAEILEEADRHYPAALNDDDGKYF